MMAVQAISTNHPLISEQLDMGEVGSSIEYPGAHDYGSVTLQK